MCRSRHARRYEHNERVRTEIMDEDIGERIGRDGTGNRDVNPHMVTTPNKNSIRIANTADDQPPPYTESALSESTAADSSRAPEYKTPTNSTTTNPNKTRNGVAQKKNKQNFAAELDLQVEPLRGVVVRDVEGDGRGAAVAGKGWRDSAIQGLG
ncbi:MAG: hypothetical protein LQ338_004910 [Usnochroma carphineum]|nr:MAG: hypothetical protein LQ338_004910 [Usnochroma carphineum]